MALEPQLPGMDPAVTEAAAPDSAEEIELWASSLHGSGAVRRFHEGLSALNRQPLPGSQRLQLMERLRPHARERLDSLARQLASQGFPLPERSRQKLEFSLQLAEEMATGYACALVDAEVDEGDTGGFDPALAAERALMYYGEFILRRAQAYHAIPERIWHNVHAIFGDVERAGVADEPAEDDELELRRPGEQTPADMYRRILLFGLSRTEGLSRGDMLALYRVLEDWAARCELGFSDSFPGARAFGVDLDRAAAPGRWTLIEAQSPSDPRKLDPTAAIVAAETALAHAADEDTTTASGHRLSAPALGHVLDQWRQKALRRSTRKQQEEQRVDVEANLSAIHTRLMLERADGLPAAEHPAPARGISERRWILADIGARGLRLRWEGRGASRAVVGELIAMLARREGRTKWPVGTVRWMQFLDDGKRFEIGVSLLSMDAEPADAYRLSGGPDSGRADDTARPALLLPADGERPERVVLPSHLFRRFETVELEVGEEPRRVRLESLAEQTGAFACFAIGKPPD